MGNQGSCQVQVCNAFSEELEYIRLWHQYGDNEESEHQWENVPADCCTSLWAIEYAFGAGATGQDWWRIEVKVRGGGTIFRNNTESIASEVAGVPNWKPIVHDLGEAEDGNKILLTVCPQKLLLHGADASRPPTETLMGVELSGKSTVGAVLNNLSLDLSYLAGEAGEVASAHFSSHPL
jgi:hypothetical protein